MGNCHYCMNCGRCRGELPKAFRVRRCPSCGHMNEQGASSCSVCGTSLVLQTGVTDLEPGRAKGGELQ